MDVYAFLGKMLRFPLLFYTQDWWFAEWDHTAERRFKDKRRSHPPTRAAAGKCSWDFVVTLGIGVDLRAANPVKSVPNERRGFPFTWKSCLAKPREWGGESFDGLSFAFWQNAHFRCVLTWRHRISNAVFLRGGDFALCILPCYIVYALYNLGLLLGHN